VSVRRLLVASVVCLVGCAAHHSAAFVKAMGVADDLAMQGKYRDAALGFAAAAAVTTRVVDRDEARHAAGRMLARAGDVHGALTLLDALANEAPPGPEAGSAAYDAASLRIASDDAEAGWSGLNAMLHRFPGDGDARPALHRLLQHTDETAGPAATLAYLRQLQAALRAPDRDEELAYEIALRLDATGDAQGARDAFLGVATRWPYPDGALWDDALYHASLLDERAGRPKEAIADLERMLERREHASLVGSAERSRYADAQLHVGELYRDKLGDHPRAEAAFHRLYTDFPESPVHDRGLFEEALLLEAGGDTKTACARLETLVKEVPDSRYAPCAPHTCPTLPAKGAPRTDTRQCHAYIERREAARTK
jgi:TolA-binding protein